jgi:hypothetical protein
VITFGMFDGIDAAAPATDAARAPSFKKLTLNSETYAFNTGIQFAPARN